MHKPLVVLGLLVAGLSIPGAAVVSAAPNADSLFDILTEFGSSRPNVSSLIGDATGLATILDNCDRDAPQYTLFLPSRKLGRGPLFDVLVDNNDKSLGELLAKPAILTAFVNNHLAAGLLSESMMLDPTVQTITMKSGEKLTKTVRMGADGRKVVQVDGQTIIDGLKTAGQPNGYSACNGVAYITDGILNPRGAGRVSLLRSGPTLYERITETTSGKDNPLKILIDAANLGDELSDCREEARPITLFLPGPGTISASVLASVLDTLEENLGSLLARPELVRSLVANHVVDGLITPDALLDPTNGSYTARSGLELVKEVGTAPDGKPVVSINGHEVVAGISASRLGTTYETCSGALYFIDGFLSPERALAAVTFAWRDAGKKWGDNRFRFGMCDQHLPWRPSCVDLP